MLRLLWGVDGGLGVMWCGRECSLSLYLTTFLLKVWEGRLGERQCKAIQLLLLSVSCGEAKEGEGR